MWSSLLESGSSFDKSIRIFTAVVLFGWLLFIASSFEKTYDEKLIELYAQPLWRVLLVLGVFFSLLWCPRVGILTTLAVFFYFHDVGAIIKA